MDAIVNTANPKPVIGSGTDSAIYEAAGKEKLLAEKTDQPDDIRLYGAAALKLSDAYLAVNRPDEAVEMLSGYDFNSMSAMAQHLYIADAQGKSVVVEWKLHNTFGGERGFHIHIVESPVCTNFLLSNGETEGKCKRFDTLTKLLSEKPVNNSEDAMKNLDAASVSWTQWSCVYHLSDFSVDVVLDNKHEAVFHISPEDFEIKK